MCRFRADVCFNRANPVNVAKSWPNLERIQPKLGSTPNSVDVGPKMGTNSTNSGQFAQQSNQICADVDQRSPEVGQFRSNSARHRADKGGVFPPPNSIKVFAESTEIRAEWIRQSTSALMGARPNTGLPTGAASFAGSAQCSGWSSRDGGAWTARSRSLGPQVTRSAERGRCPMQSILWRSSLLRPRPRRRRR